MQCDCNLNLVIHKHISGIDSFSFFSETAPGWMPQNLTDNWSTLDQVIAWCPKETGLNQANVDPDPYKQMTSLDHNALNGEH